MCYHGRQRWVSLPTAALVLAHGHGVDGGKQLFTGDRLGRGQLDAAVEADQQNPKLPVADTVTLTYPSTILGNVTLGLSGSISAATNSSSKETQRCWPRWSRST